MSTIAELVVRGELTKVVVRLPRQVEEVRQFYGRPGFMTWLRDDLPTLVALDSDSLTPAEQMYDLLRVYIGGLPLNIGRQFHRLKPVDRDVFELKTVDLRIFGWFYRKDCFIAVNGFDMERVKQHGLYGGFRDEVLRDRQRIDLDEPKYRAGATERDVISF